MRKLVADSVDRFAHVSPPIPVRFAMTAISVGTIDVFLIAAEPDVWSVLTLQRALDTRCPTAWETVHGRIEPGESPEQAAVREVREETGLAVQRLYNVTVQPFYLHKLATVELAVVFAAFVQRGTEIVLGEEHMRFEWLPPDEALDRFVWPRERSALRDVLHLLRHGDAGPVEDVLRVL
jgi:dihydroneopterin triphosphate diphosphatase